MTERAIKFLDDRDPHADSNRLASARSTVEYVDGPRDGDRELLTDPPQRLDAAGGHYRRSVRCADDGALRYVFEPDPLLVGHERSIRPC